MMNSTSSLFWNEPIKKPCGQQAMSDLIRKISKDSLFAPFQRYNNWFLSISSFVIDSLGWRYCERRSCYFKVRWICKKICYFQLFCLKWWLFWSNDQISCSLYWIEPNKNLVVNFATSDFLLSHSQTFVFVERDLLAIFSNNEIVYCRFSADDASN